MLKYNEFRERYINVKDSKIRAFLKDNPVRKLVDFDDEDNEGMEFVSFYHEYVPDNKAGSGVCAGF